MHDHEQCFRRKTGPVPPASLPRSTQKCQGGSAPCICGPSSTMQLERPRSHTCFVAALQFMEASCVVNDKFGRKLSCCTGKRDIFSSASSFSLSSLWQQAKRCEEPRLAVKTSSEGFRACFPTHVVATPAPRCDQCQLASEPWLEGALPKREETRL